MIKFFSKTFLVFILSIVTLIIFIEIASPIIRNEDDFIVASIDKEKRLDSIKVPKIVFVGGSNLAFGINSEKVEKELKKPVVNMGLLAAVGLQFMLDEAQVSIKKDDVIILSTEYYLQNDGNMKTLAMLSDLNPNAEQIITKNNFLSRSKLFCFQAQRCASSLFYKLLGGEKKVVDKILKKVYLRKSTNAHGDIIAHLNLPNQFMSGKNIMTNNDYSKSIDIMNEFIQEANKKGAKVVYFFQPYPSSQFMINKKAIIHFQHQIETQLKCNILSTPQDFVYADSLFFDSINHLNTIGREMRTNIIIEQLKSIH